VNLANGARTEVVVVHEDHLGHRTYAANLKMAADELADVEVTWVPVRYETSSAALGLLPLPGGIRAAAAGRAEVRRGLRASQDADVRIYNTQVPAALGGRRARRDPYIVITDVTPRQYDRMAEGYGHRADRNGPVRTWKHHVNRRVFGRARWCVGWSTWVTESLVADYDVDVERVTVIPPGVDTERWCPSETGARDGLRILFVGGELERKGGDLLIEAMPHLPADAELHLVTRSPVPRLERVFVYDDLVPNDARLLELYRSSDVFAMPSRAETFGIAVIEASAAGLPVVASHVGGLTDIVADRDTGIVVPPGDATALVRALRTLATDGELRRRMGAAARARAVERFDAGTNARRLFDLARDVAQASVAGTDH
jgi:glycosyltransferase involved in cell wall biosynthesis